LTQTLSLYGKGRHFKVSHDRDGERRAPEASGTRRKLAPACYSHDQAISDAPDRHVARGLAAFTLRPR